MFLPAVAGFLVKINCGMKVESTFHDLAAYEPPCLLCQVDV